MEKGGTRKSLALLYDTAEGVEDEDEGDGCHCSLLRGDNGTVVQMSTESIPVATGLRMTNPAVG